MQCVPTNILARSSKIFKRKNGDSLLSSLDCKIHGQHLKAQLFLSNYSLLFVWMNLATIQV